MKCCAVQNNQKPARGTSGLRPDCTATLVGFFIGDKMKHIPLTQGQFAIVDNEDYERLNKHKWFAVWKNNTKSFYAERMSKKENGKQHHISMAREILGLIYGDKRQADHINHDTLDNRISQLRIVTLQQNHWNNKNPKGYCWHKASKKYQAAIRVNNKSVHLGLFHTVEEAHNVYLSAKKVYHKIKGDRNE